MFVPLVTCSVDTKLTIKMLITEANELNFEQFTATFGNVIEHCPIVAAAVWSELPFQDVENLHNSICSFIDKLPLEGIHYYLVEANDGVL